jgi:adenosyl cobinamide kinase/adenosyl cobinamide phosphate guanylyltransferase
MTRSRGCSRVTLVLGGTRSGKSTLAERLAADLASDEGGTVTYVATTSITDEEMERRVAAHRARRPPTWSTVEVRSSAALPGMLARLDGLVLVDSLGAWVASALAVLSLRDDRIAGADYFLTAELLRRWGDESAIDGAEMFARFGLPAAIT